MVTTLKGIQLFVKVGSNRPSPIPYDVITTLDRVEVNDDVQELRDGFQLHFTLVRNPRLPSGIPTKTETLFKPEPRVVIGVLLNSRQYVLIYGVTTDVQLTPRSQPGIYTFIVTGRSITYQLNCENKNEKYERLSDSEIVQQIIDKYAKYGVTLKANTTNERSLDTQLIPHQTTTDLRYIKALAQRNGFVFYSQPKDGTCELYWGKENRKQVQLPILTMNMGSATNLVELSFEKNRDVPKKSKGLYLDLDSKKGNSVSPGSLEDDSLAKTPLEGCKTELLRFTAKYTPEQLARAFRAYDQQGRGGVTGTGTVDILRYPHILEAGKVVEVRGAGSTYNGEYLVTYVKHSLERGKYTQNFRLERDGTDAIESRAKKL